MAKTFHERLDDLLSDTISNLLYYDRKEDEEFPVGYIDKAVRDGHITADEIVAMFEKHLKNGLNT